MSRAYKYNRPRIGNRDLTICPCDVFQCKDGLVALAAGSDEEFQCLCQAMGKPELAENENFAPLLDRIKFENATALLEIIREWAKDKTVAEVDRLGTQYGFSSTPILDAGNRYESPRLRAPATVFECEESIYATMI